jgi:sec-independent protein translocase protein TatC
MPDEFGEQTAPQSEGTRGEGDEPVSPASTPAYSSSSDPYGLQPDGGGETRAASVTADIPTKPLRQPPSRKIPPAPPPPPPSGDGEPDDEERGMLRMSFMEHLEELRSRILRALAGLVIAFVASMFFAKDLWNVVQRPARVALQHLGINPPNLVYITPMEGFNIIWLKMPLLISIFLASPWILYQVWAFISPGLYKREKRWAVPFVLCTAGLFIAGGCFSYFVVFRFGLEFLLGIGRDVNVTPMVSINYYFDLFVNVTLGVALVFEMPVVIFFLTVLRIASPRFLLRHSRYAVLIITIIAAVVTPTPDAFNMTIFAVPMILLYFVGLFASYLLVLKREGKAFPWRLVLLSVLGALAIAAGVLALFVYRYHYHFIHKWPYLTK